MASSEADLDLKCFFFQKRVNVVKGLGWGVAACTINRKLSSADIF